jgi:hypothetical protein
MGIEAQELKYWNVSLPLVAASSGFCQHLLIDLAGMQSQNGLYFVIFLPWWCHTVSVSK